MSISNTLITTEDNSSQSEKSCIEIFSESFNCIWYLWHQSETVVQTGGWRGFCSTLARGGGGGRSEAITLGV